MINLINQFFEIENKSNQNNIEIFERNFKRINNELEEMGYFVVNPIGSNYKDTATDLEAKINEDSNSTTITKVLKPVIYQTNSAGQRELIQKGIVIVG